MCLSEKFLQVFGSEGMIQSDNKRNMQLVTHTLQSVAAEPIYTDCTVRYKDSYVNELEHFVNVLKGNISLEKVFRQSFSLHLINVILHDPLPSPHFQIKKN